MAAPEDAEAIRAIYAPIVEQTTISFETAPPDEAEMARRISGSIGSYPWLLLEQPGDVLGYAYGGSFRPREAYRWSCETTIYLAEKARGHGNASRLYSALFAFLGRQGYRQAYAGITLPNARSVGLHEALGFHHIGVYKSVGFKFGHWHNVGWWQKPLAGGKGPPSPLKSTHEVAASFDWQEL